MKAERQWFSIGAPGFDPDEVESRVVQRMLERAPARLAEPAAADYSLAIFSQNLKRLRDELDGVSVQVSVRDEKLPIGNNLWNRVKSQFHALTVLYVNELAGRQTVVNNRVVEALDALVLHATAEAEQHNKELAALRKQLDEVEAEVARLKARLQD